MKSLNFALALANAVLSIVSIVCAITAVRAVRQKRISAHRKLMLVAVGASALFMVSFVARFLCFGFTPFRGAGLLRGTYYAVFFSHEPIAVLTVPLVITAFGLAVAGSFAAHKEIARVAYPIWLYSLITGVLLFLLLYARGRD